MTSTSKGRIEIDRVAGNIGAEVRACSSPDRSTTTPSPGYRTS